MRKSHLLATASRRAGMYPPSVRLGRHGHPMRTDDRGGHTPTPTPTSTGDNTNGNPQSGSGESGSPDNGGQKFDLDAFWNSPEDKSGNPPSGESAGKSGESSGQQQQEQGEKTPAQQLMADIQGLDFGGIMNDTVIAELAEGKTEGFNKGINEMGRQAVQQAIRLMVPLMGTMREQMRAEFQQNVQGNNQSRDNEAALTKAFPSYADPKAKPLIESTFTQALKHTSGDRNKAIALTKDMLRVSAEAMGTDIGIPPKSSGDNYGRQGAAPNWLDELAGR